MISVGDSGLQKKDMFTTWANIIHKSNLLGNRYKYGHDGLLIPKTISWRIKVVYQRQETPTAELTSEGQDSAGVDGARWIHSLPCLTEHWTLRGNTPGVPVCLMRHADGDTVGWRVCSPVKFVMKRCNATSNVGKYAHKAGEVFVMNRSLAVYGWRLLAGDG